MNPDNSSPNPDLDRFLPASAIAAREYDPAQIWRPSPGGLKAPPNFGQQVVPHIFTVSGRFSLSAKSYLPSDEALLHDPANAERMRVDCGIMESLEARQRATALLNWHIEPEDDKSQDQKDLAEQLTKIISRVPRFIEFRRWLLEAIWYGRSAVATQFSNQQIGGKWRTALRRWEPRNGDKLVFRYDDGYFTTDPDEVGIRIGQGTSLHSRLASQLHESRLDGSPLKNQRLKVEATGQGLVYWFNQAERKQIIIHKHMIEDGVYEDPRTAGRIHGVGVRSRIYWTWYAMIECLQRALEYLDRSALGVEIWSYPANNPTAKARTEEAAKGHVGGGRSVVLVPVFPGENAELYGVRHIEPGLAGVDALLNVIKEYFGHKIKRYIIGQTLTSEADATGMGSGVADAHLATLADIVAYDARNLEETITNDFVRHLQLWNFPDSAQYHMRFVIDTDSPDVDKKLDALSKAWGMGLKIKGADVADMLGVSIPTDAEHAIFNPQIVGAIEQMNEKNRFDASMKDNFKESTLRNYREGLASSGNGQPVDQSGRGQVLSLV